MNGNEADSVVALDTNQAIAVLNGADDAGTWVQTFERVLLPVPVVGELRFGALKSQRASDNLNRVAQLVARCEVLEIKETTTAVYARIRWQLRQKGRPIPENDVWIAALCMEHDVPLATSDEHFLEVEGLRLINRSRF